MPFTMRHVSGTMEADPPVSALAALVDELDGADAEHPDVSVSDPSGWTLSAYPDGLVVWENVEDLDVEPRHLDDVGRSQVVEMFERVAAGDLQAIESYPWAAGYS